MMSFIEIDGNPPPPGAAVSTFIANDGAKIRYAMFPKDGARASLVLLPGRAEFIEKYFEVIGDLHARGFNVAMMDWRGQGLSARNDEIGSAGHVDDFSLMVDDLERFLEAIVSKQFREPLLFLTHSMGGAPTLQYLSDCGRAYAGAALCAPMTSILPEGVGRTGAGLLAQAASLLGFAKAGVPGISDQSMDFEGNRLTSDAERHKRFADLQKAAPQAVTLAPTFGWVRAALDTCRDLHKPNRFEGLKTPIRIITAGEEAIVNGDDHAVIADRHPLIECVKIDGAQHEIMMETDDLRAAFWSAFDAFADAQLKASA
ncbi:MAG: alpha/beta hydrolase [Pseudomonadota bacterium]